MRTLENLIEITTSCPDKQMADWLTGMAMALNSCFTLDEAYDFVEYTVSVGAETGSIIKSLSAGIAWLNTKYDMGVVLPEFIQVRGGVYQTIRINHN